MGKPARTVRAGNITMYRDGLLPVRILPAKGHENYQRIPTAVMSTGEGTKPKLHFTLVFDIDIMQGLSATARLGVHQFHAFIMEAMCRIYGEEAIDSHGNPAWDIDSPMINEKSGRPSFKIKINNLNHEPVMFSQMFDGAAPETMDEQSIAYAGTLDTAS